MVAERIAGHQAQVNYDVIPSVILHPPRNCRGGQIRGRAKAAGREYNVGMFPLPPTVARWPQTMSKAS